MHFTGDLGCCWIPRLNRELESPSDFRSLPYVLFRWCMSKGTIPGRAQLFVFGVCLIHHNLRLPKRMYWIWRRMGTSLKQILFVFHSHARWFGKNLHEFWASSSSILYQEVRPSARANVQILVTVVGHVSHKTVLLAHGRWAVGNCMSNELIKIVIDLAQFNQRDSATQLCVYTVHIYRYVCTNIYV